MKIPSLHIKSLFAALLFALALGGASAQATVIFDSLDGTTSGGFYTIAPGGSTGGPLGASFLTGASASTFNSVSVFLINPSGATTGSFSISLFSNSGSNSPGTLLETLASPSDSILSSGEKSFTYSGLSYMLAANTEYWIELSGANSTLGWLGTSNTTGIGVSGQYFYVNGGTFPNSSIGPQQMTVDTTSIASAPEPSMFFLFGVSSLGAAVYAYRRGRTTLRAN